MLNKVLEQQCVNTLRMLSVDAIQQANSGHPGLPLGAAPALWSLFAHHLNIDAADEKWFNRDRFVLSAGHGSALLYATLHLFGFDISLEDLSQFRQLNSRTPGHPEYGHTPGVEMTTGPLGQGLASAVGMAAAEKHMAARYNTPECKLVDHYTYALAGDGCMMEGISYEAASLAGTWKLGKLILLYDSNRISIEGGTELAFTENVAARFAAMGWQTLRVQDGNDTVQISEAIAEAKKDPDRPTFIEIQTQIGYGCPARQGKASAHGEPLGAENITATRAFLGWGHEPFAVPDEVYEYAKARRKRTRAARKAWLQTLKEYQENYPEQSRRFLADISGEADLSFLQDASYWAFEGSQATRNTSAEVLARLCNYVPNFFGGSADLAPSTKAVLPGRGDFGHTTPQGANLHFGVRELSMAAICNGIALHGGLRPYCATFFVFSDYVKPVARLSALMNLPVIYVLTHDSIGVGEDGPTHQPVEQLAMLRSLPNFTVYRPADGPETAAAYAYALQTNRPVALALTRQNLPTLPGTGPDALHGGYALHSGSKNPDILLMASGSEVHLIAEAAQCLLRHGVTARVVSMPSMEVFNRQSPEYRETVLPGTVRKRLAVEAGSSMCWHQYVGLDGAVMGIDSFGASGPAGLLFKQFGFTVDGVVKRALELLAK